MDFVTVSSLITGTGGALIVLLAWVYSISQGSKSVIGTIPAYVYASSEERIKVLDQENSALNTAVITLTKENAGMEARIDGLGRELEGLRAELTRLRRDVNHGEA